MPTKGEFRELRKSYPPCFVSHAGEDYDDGKVSWAIFKYNGPTLYDYELLYGWNFDYINEIKKLALDWCAENQYNLMEM